MLSSDYASNPAHLNMQANNANKLLLWLKKKKKEKKEGESTITFSSTPKMIRHWCCCYVIIESSVDFLVVKSHRGRREKLLG